MPKAFQAGWDKGAKVNLGTAAALIVLDVIDQQFDEMTTALLIQCASLGARPVRIGGFGDSGGTISCELDGNNPPYIIGAGKLNVVSGATGVYQGYVNTVAGGPGTFFTVGIFVEKVHYGIPANGKANFVIDWKENALVQAFQFPAS